MRDRGVSSSQQAIVAAIPGVDAAGHPVIVYQSTFADPVDNVTVRELKVARGTPR